MSTDDTVIYDLSLALNEYGFIDNDKVWNDISLNKSDETPNVSLIIYANDGLISASWKNIILKKDNFPEFPTFSSLSFDGANEDIYSTFYGKVISVEITGFKSLSEIKLNCVSGVINLDISNNGLSDIDIDHILPNVRSITMRNMTLKGIFLSEPTLEYLDMTNTTLRTLQLEENKLKSLIGFNHNTLISVEIEGEEEPPELILSNFKLPISLDNFPSDMRIALDNGDYFPTGLDTIEKIESLRIRGCKNNNKIRNFYINNCNEIELSHILGLNRVKINNIDESGEIEIIANIDLVTLELPYQNFSNLAFALYANINLSEIICNGISYGKEDSDNDLVALCNKLNIILYTSSNYENPIKHTLGFNKLYIKEEDYWNINPQIYKNSKLLGNPLTKYDNVLNYGFTDYYYIKLPNPIDNGIANSTQLQTILNHNCIDYNNNNIIINAVYKRTFVALGLNEVTAESLVEALNQNESEVFVFTDKPELLKGVKYHKVINPFTYTPDLANVFEIKLVVY